MRLVSLLLILLAPAFCPAQEIFNPAGGRRSAFESGFDYGGGSGAFYRESRFSAASPLGRTGPWNFRLALHGAHLHSVADGYLPGGLYRVGTAVSAAKGRAGFKLGARSNSDRPFGSPDTADFSGDFTYVISTGAYRVIAGVNYSSRRSFLPGLPFPYLLYSYISDKIQFALPFFLRARLGARWRLTFAYIPVKNGRAAIRYETPGGAFTEFELSSQLEQYLPYRRPDKEQRLYRSRASAALRRGIPLGRGFTAEVQAGYAFSNYYFTGEKYDDVNARTSLGPWPFAGVNLKLIPGAKPDSRL